MYLSLLNEDKVEDMEIKRRLEITVIIFNLILIVLAIFFNTRNLSLIYLFFEIKLIPIFMIVLYRGNNSERLEASSYLLIYIIFISFPLSVYIVKLYRNNFYVDINLIGHKIL